MNAILLAVTVGTLSSVQGTPARGAATESSWLVSVSSAEVIKPGTTNEPSAPPGKAILKVGVKFKYTGPEGEVPGPVLKVTDGTGGEHVMLGNLQGAGLADFDCVQGLISAGNVRIGEKPKTISSSTLAKCGETIFYYYFSLPENPTKPLVLVFADAKPVSLTVK
jgi:hypothetical protein